jgi:tetratricopeptide (TPR) repeat protein
MKQLYILFTILLITGFSGCESAPISTDFMLASLEGKIFDYDNTPCSDVLITIDKGAAVRSDINGRFVIPGVGKGLHDIKATKEGYEEYTEAFSFSNRNQILWIRMISIKQLETRIETAFEDRKWDELESLVDRALKIKNDDPVILYLQALYFNQNGWFDQAIEVLTKITETGHAEATVYLTMADIYQYKLQQKNRAIECLGKYLEKKTDDAAYKRLEALKKSL